MPKRQVPLKSTDAKTKAKRVRPRPPQSVPLELAGRWLAWSADGYRIIGSGKTLEEAQAAASAAGEEDPIFEVAPGKFTR
jgi:hypothetical protein